MKYKILVISGQIIDYFLCDNYAFDEHNYILDNVKGWDNKEYKKVIIPKKLAVIYHLKD